MTRISRKRAERLYEELHAKIRTVVKTFHKKYGGDFYELIAEANGHFMDIITGYGAKDKNRGLSLEQKVRNGVWWGLLMRKRQWVKRDRILHQTAMPDDVKVQGGETFDVVDFLITLSDKAKFVVQSIIHPPAEFQRLLDKIERLNGQNVRIALKVFLAAVGWSPEKIQIVFKEVKIKLTAYSEDK